MRSLSVGPKRDIHFAGSRCYAGISRTPRRHMASPADAVGDGEAGRAGPLFPRMPLRGLYHAEVPVLDAVELSALDARWQLVLGTLGNQEPAFSQGALQSSPGARPTPRPTRAAARGSCGTRAQPAMSLDGTRGPAHVALRS